MSDLNHLLKNNQEWAANIEKQNPGFFEKLSKQQKPDYLWIGCSDSRVPANQLLGLAPGEVFVHRNIANQVIHTDLNALSVIQYAVDVLQIKHVIVCGHYGCGGVQAALEKQSHGLIDNWLRHIQDTEHKFQGMIRKVAPLKQLDRLCEVNVIQQVLNVARTGTVREAWARGQDLTLHGWVYGLEDGLVQDQAVSVSSLIEALALKETIQKEIDQSNK